MFTHPFLYVFHGDRMRGVLLRVQRKAAVEKFKKRDVPHRWTSIEARS